MIPPIDEDVLKNNPDFERVYKKVTGALLNPDGSTRDDAVAKKRESVREELKEHRLRATRRHILLQAIKTAVPSSSPEPASTTTTTTTTTTQTTASTTSGRPHLPHRRTRSSSSFSTTTTCSQQQQQQQPPTQTPLPPELLEILFLLPPLLREAPSLPAPSLALLLTTAPLSHLPTHFPILLSHLSSHLTTTATTLARILHPSTNSSYIHRTIATLPATTTTLLANLTSTQTALTTSRLHATATLKAALDKNTRAVAQLLRLLETKHGPAARSTALRAEMAALDAQTWSLAAQALRWDATASWYPAEARGALAGYQRHLGGARMRMADAVRVREAELAEFGVVVVMHGEEGDEGDGGQDEGRSAGNHNNNNMSQKEKTLREMARVYNEMEGKMVEVKADLERLGMS